MGLWTFNVGTVDGNSLSFQVSGDYSSLCLKTRVYLCQVQVLAEEELNSSSCTPSMIFFITRPNSRVLSLCHVISNAKSCSEEIICVQNDRILAMHDRMNFKDIGPWRMQYNIISAHIHSSIWEHLPKVLNFMY